MNSLAIHAGPEARAHLQQHGLRAADVALIPAAAGGPKGLIFQHLDQWLFGTWLPSAPRSRVLVGSSIGAWRMAAACHADPVAAFERLTQLYCEDQRYPHRPSATQVTQVCQTILRRFVGGHEKQLLSNRQYQLQLITARGTRLLASPHRPFSALAGFAAAAASNLISRRHLARHLQRVVLSDPNHTNHWLSERFDSFDTRFAPLTPDNLQSALLASGTLPLIMDPVTDLPHAPPGNYWDGGLVDYHLALPYHRIEGLVLYPHFNQHIAPGWLDKSMPWRRAARGPHRHWLDNVIILSPTREFLHTLPRQKLPDRKDFVHYGLNHDERITQWKKAISEGQRLQEELQRFIEAPDMKKVTPI